MSNGIINNAEEDLEINLERTTPQVYAEPGKLSDAELPDRLRRNYKTYQEMRLDPTLAFARMICVSPLVSAGWTYQEKEYAPLGAKEFIKAALEPLRIRLMKSALEGYVDYGWAGYEMVKRVDEWGFITIKKLKPLLHSYTYILVDKDHGEYIGMRQEMEDTIDVSTEDSVCLTFDTEGTDWYGTPLLENARKVWEAYKQVETASVRYDNKVAGTHWVIHYPVGSSPYNGKTEDNFVIAQAILASITSSGMIIVPRKIEQYIDDMNSRQAEDAWKIEMMSDSGAARTQFIDREKYLDALKVRSLGIPERAILEGQFGTKAESAAQADFAIMNIELRHTLITQQINQQVVNNLLELNWGREYIDTVCVEPNPLADDKVGFFRQLYLALVSARAPATVQTLDMGAMQEKIGLPVLEQGEQYAGQINTNDPTTYPMVDPNAPESAEIGGQSLLNDPNLFNVG